MILCAKQGQQLRWTKRLINVDDGSLGCAFWLTTFVSSRLDWASVHTVDVLSFFNNLSAFDSGDLLKDTLVNGILLFSSGHSLLTSIGVDDDVLVARANLKTNNTLSSGANVSRLIASCPAFSRHPFCRCLGLLFRLQVLTLTNGCFKVVYNALKNRVVDDLAILPEESSDWINRSL